MKKVITLAAISAGLALMLWRKTRRRHKDEIEEQKLNFI